MLKVESLPTPGLLVSLQVHVEQIVWWAIVEWAIVGGQLSGEQLS